MAAKEIQVEKQAPSGAMGYIASKMGMTKYLLAAFICVLLILGSVLYFIASKGGAANGTFEKVFKENGKDVHKILTLGSTSIKLGLAKGLLIISLLSIPLMFFLLGMGTHKNIAVSLTIQIISFITFIVLLVLVSLVVSNLATVNGEITWIAKPTKILAKP